MTQEDIDEFFAATWEVHYNSSRTGIRLIGPQPKWARPDGGEAGLHPSNLHDNAYAVGTVDFTGDMPIILGVDGPSLGGFACPVTIVSAELWKMGQLRSGDKVRFVPLSAEDAEKIRLAREETLEAPEKASKAMPLLTPSPVTSPIISEFNKDSEMEHVVVRADGDDNVLVEFGPAIIDLRLRFTAHAWMLAVKERFADVLIDVTPGIRSIQIHYDIRKIRQKDVLERLWDLAEHLRKNKLTKVPTRTIYLPLSWDDPQTRIAIEKYVTTVRPDAPWCCPNNIEFIRRVNGLESIDDVKQTVFAADYLVMGLGDVYLGAPVATPLDPRHRLVTTKYNPARTWTPENAVGIGGAYMCVYGMEGPGGYQFVGRTVQMWNRFKKTSDFPLPYLLRFFDQIRFYEVSADKLLQMRKDFAAGKFHVVVENSSFDIEEYERFLAVNAESISAFEEKRTKAFEEEKERWIANGQFTFESHSAQTTPIAEITLADGEDGVYSPVAGSLWKLIAKPEETVKAGDTLAIIESMKTEIPVIAASGGIVSQVFVKESSEVKAGQCLLAVKKLS